jgi:hypothetical protein
VGSLTDCTRILGLGGFRVTRVELEGKDAETPLAGPPGTARATPVSVL